MFLENSLLGSYSLNAGKPGNAVTGRPGASPARVRSLREKHPEAGLLGRAGGHYKRVLFCRVPQEELLGQEQGLLRGEASQGERVMMPLQVLDSGTKQGKP